MMGTSLSFLPHITLNPLFNQYSPLSVLLTPSQSVELRVLCPGGLTPGSPAADNTDCLVMPQSQRQSGKPCGQAPHQSGAGRNPLLPDKTD